MIKNKRIRLLEELPEGCIATILSCATPVDACRLSILSKSFRSAADSDTVWDRFLISDSIILQSPSLANTFTKKDLYMALSDRPIIIDQGTKVFFFFYSCFRYLLFYFCGQSRSLLFVLSQWLLQRGFFWFRTYWFQLGLLSSINQDDQNKRNAKIMRIKCLVLNANRNCIC